MAHKRSTTPPYTSILARLWEQQLRISRRRYNNSRFKRANQLDAFTPRIYLGIKSGRQLWRIPETPETQDEIARGLFNIDTLTLRNDHMAALLYTELLEKGLKDYTTSSPKRPPLVLFNLYKDGVFHSHVSFAATYAAKRFLDEVIIRGEPHTWVKDSTILIPSYNIRISASPHDWELVMDHKDNHLERMFELPQSYHRIGDQLRGITKLTPSDDAPATTIVRTPAKSTKTTGSTSLADLAAELGVDTTTARQRLRKAKLIKPAGGWHFTPDELPSIKKIIMK